MPRHSKGGFARASSGYPCAGCGGMNAARGNRPGLLRLSKNWFHTGAAAPKPSRCKGRWRKSLICAGGIALSSAYSCKMSVNQSLFWTIPQSPSLCDGDWPPLHKGASAAVPPKSVTDTLCSPGRVSRAAALHFSVHVIYCNQWGPAIHARLYRWPGSTLIRFQPGEGKAVE